ncbi:MAG TPA: hypothetical protein VMT08_20185 [Bradyrhizobium sp.]|nr:hypothetical protein [Bradyrhizobium sp.]
MSNLRTGRRANQDQVRAAMVKALRQWLENHQLPAIIAAVLGVVMTISVLMVAVGYLVARQ